MYNKISNIHLFDCTNDLLKSKQQLHIIIYYCLILRVQEVNENNSDQTSLDNSQPGTGLADGRAVDDIEDNISKRQKKVWNAEIFLL